MKKIIIISYFFPPSNFVGGQRTEFWAKELHRFGYYPIIVTRNWNDKQIDLTDAVENNELKVEKCEHYEVHRLPYRQSLRDKLAQKSRYKYLQKALTFWELIFSNFSISALPYGNFYSYCDQLLQQGDITTLIASGRPFQSFQIGHKLRKKHEVLWIPDYRDEWNSHYRTEINGTLLKFATYLERKSEKRWTSNADHFLTVGDLWAKRIEAFTGTKGSVVKNGYDAISPKKERADNDINVLYGGTLYPYQDISPIVDSILEIDNPRLKFYFIGVFADPSSRIYFEKSQRENPERIHLIDKLPKDEYTVLISKMDIGVLTSYKNTDGWLPVKVYDYYANGLNLLLYPTDNDLMAEFINQTKSGAVVNSKEECRLYFENQLSLTTNEQRPVSRDYELGKEYSRLFQSEILAETIDSLLKSK